MGDQLRHNTPKVPETLSEVFVASLLDFVSTSYPGNNFLRVVEKHYQISLSPRHICTSTTVTMSWQAYIDTSLVGSGNVDEAGLFSVNGKDNWAKSAGFKMTPAEVAELLKAFDSPDTAYANGLKINGEKYTVIQVLGNSGAIGGILEGGGLLRGGRDV